MSRRILVVDDEPSLRELLRIVLESEGYFVRDAATFAAAVDLLTREKFSLVICDIFLPDGNGMDIVRTFHASNPSTAFVVITAHTTPAHALTALREGAVEYISKPFDVDELKLVIAKELRRIEEAPALPAELPFIGSSRVMRQLVERLPQIAASDATVLIAGESGTGKELLARAIHDLSPRAARLFVPVNCGALPEGLLESELFGHVRGSFTGAVRDKRGLVQEAHGGTLFLDEVGELSTNTQVKLLRALQERRIRPVGDNREVDVDIRVIVATNADLAQLVRTGRFREDLFYRINVLNVTLPPLRSRPEDVSSLAHHFVQLSCARLGVSPKQLHRDTLAVLESYAWPGNVRELENVVERMVAMEASSLLTVSSLPPSVLGAETRAAEGTRELTLPLHGLDIEAHLDTVRMELMRQALQRCGGVQKEAAKLLRMTYRAFRYHALKYNLTILED